MQEIYRTHLRLDYLKEELRFILTRTDLLLEMHRAEEDAGPAVPICRLSLPLSLWPRFYESICCLGAFMIPLPAPAYQARPCCSCVCPLPPGPVVLEPSPQEQLHLSLQERRGSTFLEIKSVRSPAGTEEIYPVCVGPTLWSAFLTALQTLAKIIADL